MVRSDWLAHCCPRMYVTHSPKSVPLPPTTPSAVTADSPSAHISSVTLGTVSRLGCHTPSNHTASGSQGCCWHQQVPQPTPPRFLSNLLHRRPPAQAPHACTAIHSRCQPLAHGSELHRPKRALQHNHGMHHSTACAAQQQAQFSNSNMQGACWHGREVCRRENRRCCRWCQLLQSDTYTHRDKPPLPISVAAFDGNRPTAPAAWLRHAQVLHHAWQHPLLHSTHNPVAHSPSLCEFTPTCCTAEQPPRTALLRPLQAWHTNLAEPPPW